jgi:hypothetical protein
MSVNRYLLDSKPFAQLAHSSAVVPIGGDDEQLFRATKISREIDDLVGQATSERMEDPKVAILTAARPSFS